MNRASGSGRSTVVLMLVFIIVMAAVLWTGARMRQDAGLAPHRPPIDNPVPATGESIATGKTIYDGRCADCHGESGKGDGEMADIVRKPPSDLTDADWDLGSTDGDLYRVIHDGTRSGMRGFKNTLSDTEIWNVVNYVRTLGPRPDRTGSAGRRLDGPRRR